jgi:hypothetical protein
VASDETHKVLCGRCHVPVDKGTDAQGQDIVTCPSCGESDTVENASREAGEYYTSKLVRDAFSGFGSGSSSDFLKITVTPPPQRHYRFIVD